MTGAERSGDRRENEKAAGFLGVLSMGMLGLTVWMLGDVGSQREAAGALVGALFTGVLVSGAVGRIARAREVDGEVVRAEVIADPYWREFQAAQEARNTGTWRCGEYVITVRWDPVVRQYFVSDAGAMVGLNGALVEAWTEREEEALARFLGKLEGMGWVADPGVETLAVRARLDMAGWVEDARGSGA